VAQDIKLNPETILNNKSGRITIAYKKAILAHAVQTMYELIFALIFLCNHKSFIVGIYPAVETIPALAYANFKIKENISSILVNI
jgi:hypothetical protein